MLTANDIALVRASFAKVLPIKDAAADLFYNRLFEIAPQLRPMFPADLKAQKTKLMAMIAAAVGGLHDLKTLVPHVKALGARHAGYGVTVAHYAIVGEALMWTLERGLGDAFTAGGPLRLGQGLWRAGRHHADRRHRGHRHARCVATQPDRLGQRLHRIDATRRTFSSARCLLFRVETITPSVRPKSRHSWRGFPC